MWTAARKTVSLGVSCACVGMIIGVTTLTGVGNVLGNYILDISQGNLFLTLILVMIMSIIMGMGMPTVAVYIVQATVTAPVLVELGIPTHRPLLLLLLRHHRLHHAARGCSVLRRSGDRGQQPLFHRLGRLQDGHPRLPDSLCVRL
ncbi:MAG: TRAP transporter large permease subunit [Dysosmobacter sp.]